MLNDSVERLLITDFGVASVMDDATVTQTGMIAGTPQFMSPEQARGESVDHKSDFFSLGSVLYTASTGRAPFRADGPMAVLRKITDTEPKSIRTINPDIPDWLEGIILRLLEKDKADRFDDAGQIEELFEKCLTHLRQPTLTALPQQVVKLQRERRRVDPIGTTTFGMLTAINNKVWIALSAVFAAFLAVLLFAGAPEIDGDWQGESWQHIRLTSVKEADNWISGTFIDSQQQPGAIHLEWSPLRRQFHGRWSIGSEESGTIVLRRVAKDRVRGAILLDADARRPQGDIRLRDFEWSVGAGASERKPLLERSITTAESSQSQPSARAVAIVAPIGGIVSKLGPNAREGNHMKRGELICAIQQGKAAQEPLRTHLDILQKKLAAAKQKAEAYARNTQELTAAFDYSVAAANEMVNAAMAKCESRANHLFALEATKKQAQHNFERASRLHKEGLSEADNVKEAQSLLDVAVANVKAAQSEVKMLRSEQRAQEIERKEKERIGHSKVNASKTKHSEALSEINVITKEIADLEVKLAETEVTSILAPSDGIVVDLLDIRPGEVVRSGVVLCGLKPHENGESPVGSTSSSSGLARMGTTLQSMQTMMTLAADYATRIQQAREQMQKVEKRDKWLRAVIEETKKKLQESPKGADDDAAAESELANIKLAESELHDRQELRSKAIARFELVRNELQATIDLLRLELLYYENELESARQHVQLQRLLSEQGDIRKMDVLASESALRKVEITVEQIQRVMQHFAAISAEDED